MLKSQIKWNKVLSNTINDPLKKHDMTKWHLSWEYKYGLILGKSISIIPYITCSKEKLSDDYAPDIKSMYCLIPFMKNSRKCKPTYSDGKLCSWLGFDGWWARYDENGQGEITKDKMRVFQTMNLFIILIIVMISWIFTYIMLQSTGSQRVRDGWAAELKTCEIISCTCGLLYVNYISIKLLLGVGVFFLISKIQPFCVSTSTANHSDPKATATWMPCSVGPSQAESPPLPEYSILSGRCQGSCSAGPPTHPQPLC